MQSNNKPNAAPPAAGKPGKPALPPRPYPPNKFRSSIILPILNGLPFRKIINTATKSALPNAPATAQSASPPDSIGNDASSTTPNVIDELPAASTPEPTPPAAAVSSIHNVTEANSSADSLAETDDGDDEGGANDTKPPNTLPVDHSMQCLHNSPQRMSAASSSLASLTSSPTSSVSSFTTRQQLLEHSGDEDASDTVRKTSGNEEQEHHIIEHSSVSRVPTY